ncbi:type II toxin-antitoxin system death-on-curing family toxin [Listeria grandensis]|uniref:type II toxin-antitoxin system death-on-curing family toxin n=1 Tax=Listeria grandensis TaxID=1494963 RepID=UPI001C8A2FB6|nr:type II toxin-antitoxin system death-on-curing family toxin [Listeria grandensis]
MAEFMQKRYAGKIDGDILEPGSLNMCIEQPKQIVFERELYPTLHDKAGILYKSLIIQHCFANANNRTALASLGLFLKCNGWQLLASNQDAEDFTVAIALDSNMELAKISDWIEKNSAMPR